MPSSAIRSQHHPGQAFSRRSITVFSLLVFQGTLLAADVAAADSPSLLSLSFKLLLALVLIIVMIYLTAWIARRRFHGRGGDRGGIRILAHHYVGPRKMIQLLQVGERGFLIGVTERNISSLGELNAAELEQFTASGEQPVQADFSASLKSVLKRRDRNG